MGHPCKHIFDARTPSARKRPSDLTHELEGRAETYACRTCGEAATILRVGPLRRMGHVKHLFCRACAAYVGHRRIA